MSKLVVNEQLIGKYINKVLWSDVYPVGKIVGIKTKTKVIVQIVKASENKTKMEYIVGGFAGHCINQGAQRYDFTLTDETFEASLSNNSLKKNFWTIDDCPRKWYDYNF